MKRSSHLVREILETLALTFIIFVVIHFTVQNYMVDGTSMQPGLNNSQYVLVNKLAYLFHSPERGDVIVFHWPVDTTKDLIKRVIGIPGDVIVIDKATVQINGVLLKEPYVKTPFNPVGIKLVVPPNDYFVMGDNRQVSDDSRDWGFVPKSYIIGKAVMVYWPINSWHFIDSYSTVFSASRLTTKGSNTCEILIKNIHCISPRGMGAITHLTMIPRMTEAASRSLFNPDEDHSISARRHPPLKYLAAISVKL